MPSVRIFAFNSASMCSAGCWANVGADAAIDSTSAAASRRARTNDMGSSLEIENRFPEATIRRSKARSCSGSIGFHGLRRAAGGSVPDSPWKGAW